MKDPMVLVLDANRGIYIPQLFARHCNPLNSQWVWDYEGLKDDLSNPDNENYWEAWLTVVDTAYLMVTGKDYKYFLYEDGDLFAIHSDYSVNEFGEVIGNDETSIN